jgi:hypothetical protein
MQQKSALRTGFQSHKGDVRANMSRNEAAFSFSSGLNMPIIREMKRE